MKKFALSILIALISLGMNAQDVEALFAENPYRAANNMHSYEFVEIHDTPAPKGFKPFYISHYGRHGSRFELSTTFGNPALRVLNHLDSLGLLTASGKNLRDEIKTIQDAHIGRDGSLTKRGASEHRQLAARMAERFPEVFKNKDRQEVDCMSSTVQRCIMSMTNFTYSLKEQFPGLQFSFESAERFMAFINPSLSVHAPGYVAPPRPQFARKPAEPAEAKPGYRPDPGTPGRDFSRFLKPLFTDYDAALKEIGNPEPMIRSAFSAGGLCEVTDFLGLDLYHEYFTPDELVYFWQNGNDMIYRMWAGSVENGDNVRYAERPLLKDFIDDADVALADGSHRAADLRFGHDTSVLPLFALLGVDDPQGRRFPYAEAHSNGWYAFYQIPMATNCQMIFYRNKKNETLVKVLYNEKEVNFPKLHSDVAPYYKWEDFRAYCQNLIDWK